MQFQSYTCDECGRVKGEANHWFWCVSRPGPRFVLAAWSVGWTAQSGDDDQVPAVKHLCGIGCAAKAMQKAMTEQA